MAKVSRYGFARIKGVIPAKVYYWVRKGYLTVDADGMIDTDQEIPKLKSGRKKIYN